MLASDGPRSNPPSSMLDSARPFLASVGCRRWKACLMPTMTGHEPTRHVCGGIGSDGIIQVTSERLANALAAEVLNPDRYFPIICLTACAGEHTPALDPGQVRAIVGPHIPIYVITKFFLMMKLANRLPPRLGVLSGAARVWWPEVTQESVSAEHPRFFDPAKRDTVADGYRRLASEFHVPEHPELTIEQQLILSERGRAKEERRRAVEQRLAEQHRDRAERRRGDRHTPPAPHASTEGPEHTLHLAPPAEQGLLDPEQRLHILIAFEWTQAQSSPADRHEHPLGRYTFGRQFLRSVQRKPAGVDMNRVARICAMVACKRAAQAGCEPHPLRQGPSPTAPQWQRADGATAWRCALKGGPGGPRLHYWQPPDGTIEFASVVVHDDFSIPGA